MQLQAKRRALRHGVLENERRYADHRRGAGQRGPRHRPVPHRPHQHRLQGRDHRRGAEPFFIKYVSNMLYNRR